jgi:hypothetical protein
MLFVEVFGYYASWSSGWQLLRKCGLYAFWFRGSVRTAENQRRCQQQNAELD